MRSLLRWKQSGPTGQVWLRQGCKKRFVSSFSCVRGMHLRGSNNIAMAVQLDAIYDIDKYIYMTIKMEAAILVEQQRVSGDLSTQSHLWCIFDCRTKALKARSRFLHPLGNHSNLPEVFPTNCTFVAPAHFTKFMGPHRICFMCLESNPKSREPKRKENNWTLGVQLPGRSWHATCSKRVTTGFSICGRRKKQWMHQILFSDKTIKTEAIDRVFGTTYIYQELKQRNCL